MYICLLWNLSVQQINTLNFQNGSSDIVIVPLRLNSLLTKYLGFYSSREEFQSFELTRLLKNLKTKALFSETDLMILVGEIQQIWCTYSVPRDVVV